MAGAGREGVGATRGVTRDGAGADTARGLTLTGAGVGAGGVAARGGVTFAADGGGGVSRTGVQAARGRMASIAMS